MNRTLGRVARGKYRDRIANLVLQHASASGDISPVLHDDVTTLYFEAQKKDELRKATTRKNAA